MTLDLQSSGLSFLVPHGRREILLRVDDLVLTLINVQTIFLHLNAKFAHHNRRFRFVLICLYLSLYFVWMVVGCLVSLSERVVVCHTVSVVSESTEVRFSSLLLLDCNSHNFNLKR